MQTLIKKIVDKWDDSGYSLAEMASRTDLSESTLRRFRAGEGMAHDTVVRVARAVGIDLDALAESLPEPTAIAVKMIEEDMANKYHPHSSGCATSCPARAAMQDNLATIERLYEARLAERAALYEARLKEQHELYDRGIEVRKIREKHFGWAVVVLAGLTVAMFVLCLWLVLVDAKIPDWGLIQYPMGYFDAVTNDTTNITV